MEKVSPISLDEFEIVLGWNLLGKKCFVQLQGASIAKYVQVMAIKKGLCTPSKSLIMIRMHFSFPIAS